ncbi:MAG: PilZ domain-containing protein [Kangiellaceae bacterium]|jgi:hypothetical protein|nr:PilZ domain-containing protein [Kangiellaceae bacterium]
MNDNNRNTELDSLSPQERRRFKRALHESQVTIELTGAEQTLQQRKISCNTLDISSGGLRVNLNPPLSIGSILELCIRNRQDKLMLLYAEVKWCEQINTEFQCCLELLNAESSDIEHWLIDL